MGKKILSYMSVDSDGIAIAPCLSVVVSGHANHPRLAASVAAVIVEQAKGVLRDPRLNGFLRANNVPDAVIPAFHVAWEECVTWLKPEDPAPAAGHRGGPVMLALGLITDEISINRMEMGSLFISGGESRVRTDGGDFLRVIPTLGVIAAIGDDEGQIVWISTMLRLIIIPEAAVNAPPARPALVYPTGTTRAMLARLIAPDEDDRKLPEDPTYLAVIAALRRACMRLHHCNPVLVVDERVHHDVDSEVSFLVETLLRGDVDVVSLRALLDANPGAIYVSRDCMVIGHHSKGALSVWTIRLAADEQVAIFRPIARHALPGRQKVLGVRLDDGRGTILDRLLEAVKARDALIMGEEV